MSELTPCNYCSLQGIKARAKMNGCKVYLRNSTGSLGGIDVFVVPLGKKLDTRVDERGESIGGQWKAWFMELTDHCVC